MEKVIDTVYKNEMLRGYLECALWSSNDADNEDTPFDRDYSIDDIAEETINQAIEDCNSFMEKAGEIKDTDNDDGRIGHDFWLTRNGHGAGFWDGDYPIDGDRLTELCKTFKECYMYVGDDGKIYID
jgi:hypothetical protein